MFRPSFLLFLLLLLAPTTLGNQEDDTRLLLLDMTGRLEKMESELLLTKSELLLTKSDLETNKSDLDATKSDLNATKSDLNATKSELQTTKSKLDVLETNLPATVSRAVRDLPNVMVCAYQTSWTTANSVVTYKKLICDYKPNGGDGNLDIISGVYTSLTAGFYTISVSAQPNMDAGKYVDFYLFHNGQRLEESYVYSMAGGTVGSNASDQGSLTMVRIFSLSDH